MERGCYRAEFRKSSRHRGPLSGHSARSRVGCNRSDAGRRGAKTAGRRRIENETTDGHQRGDPARGAQVIIKAVEASDAPHLLLLGSDAIQVVGAALDADRAMLEAWKATSLTTDFPT